MVEGIERADKGVNGFRPEEINEMKAYLQGCVYAWCNLKGEEWFSARDFLGGDNYFWEGTPMCKLYNHYNEKGGEDYAFDEAAKAAGRAKLKKCEQSANCMRQRTLSRMG